MKKILVAAIAAALIAPAAAFADVKISGFVEQNFTIGDRATANDYGMDGASDVGVVFSASEDLGNGMKAFAKIDMGKDNGGSTQNDQIVGMSGGFGTVVVGRMEDFTEGKVMATASIFEGGHGLEPGTGQNAGRFDNAIAYVSPTFSGFHAGIAGYALDAETTVAATSIDNTFDAVDMIAAYSNGPITVMLARESIDTAAATAAGLAETSTSLAVKYKAGAMNLVAVAQKANDDAGVSTADTTDWMVGGDFTFGNNKVVLGYESDETSATNTDSNLQVEFQHMFSKRTKVYVGHHAADAANSDETYFGMKHTF